MNLEKIFKEAKDFVYQINDKYYRIGLARVEEADQSLIESYIDWERARRQLKSPVMEKQLEKVLEKYEKLIRKLAISSGKQQNDYLKKLDDIYKKISEEEKASLIKQNKWRIIFDTLKSRKDANLSLDIVEFEKNYRKREEK